MPRYTGPNYGGDYDEVTAAKLADVGLPERLLCRNCGMDKPIDQYSKRQKSNLRWNIRSKKNALSIICRACTPQVNNELLCIMCDHVKDLSAFAKNHRSKPEQARCKECMYEQMVNDEPGLEEYSADSDSEVSNPHESDDDTQTESGNTLPLTLGNLHIRERRASMTSDTSDSRKRILSSRLPLSSISKSQDDSTADNLSFRNEAFSDDDRTEDDLRSNASTIGGVELGSESAAPGSRASVSEASIFDDDSRSEAMSAANRWKRMKTIGYRAGSIADSEEPTSSEKGKGRAFTGYDPQGNAHRRFRAPSVVSDTTSISYSARNNFPRVRPESAFANSKALGNRNLMPSRDDFPTNTGHHVGWDEDDDDDEGEMYL